jgi:hypothetical protein
MIRDTLTARGFDWSLAHSQPQYMDMHGWLVRELSGGGPLTRGL